MNGITCILLLFNSGPPPSLACWAARASMNPAGVTFDRKAESAPLALALSEGTIYGATASGHNHRICVQIAML